QDALAASVPAKAGTVGKRSRLARGEAVTGWLFVAPWILGFALFTLGPILFSLYTSFTRYNMIRAPEWIGTNNYAHILGDRFFWLSLHNTFWMVLVKTPIVIVLALAIAVLLNLELPWTRAFRTIVYLPSVLSGVAAIFLWRWILAPNGLLNEGLAVFGIRGPAWFSDPDWTKPGLVIMGLWWIGVDVIIYLASLKGIDKTLYEAAEIDGASGWAKNWHITIPLLSPTTFFLMVTSIIGTFQIFTTAYIITSNPAVKTVGGPASSLLFYVLYLYKRAFGQQVGPGGFQMGYASALAWILFVIILLVTLLQLVLAKRWVYYEADR
ncbi:MAG TPA: sugar ABC transporter permease, partial [Trueperaceae bacterium]